jgi:predicted RecA/RadA family phage recombinase
MTNYGKKGSVITATAPYDVASGAGALIAAAVFGVATAAILNAATGEFQMDGVVYLTRETGASSAWTEGAPVYWDNTNKRVTKTASGNTKIGVGVLPLPVDADASGWVRLNGTAG